MPQQPSSDFLKPSRTIALLKLNVETKHFKTVVRKHPGWVLNCKGTIRAFWKYELLWFFSKRIDIISTVKYNHCLNCWISVHYWVDAIKEVSCSTDTVWLLPTKIPICWIIGIWDMQVAWFSFTKSSKSGICKLQAGCKQFSFLIQPAKYVEIISINRRRHLLLKS